VEVVGPLPFQHLDDRRAVDVTRVKFATHGAEA
jgi:hypothetical protein